MCSADDEDEEEEEERQLYADNNIENETRRYQTDRTFLDDYQFFTDVSFEIINSLL